MEHLRRVTPARIRAEVGVGLEAAKQMLHSTSSICSFGPEERG